MISVNIEGEFFGGLISAVDYHGFIPGSHCSGRAISSVVERFLHTEEAAGSIPASPTNLRLIYFAFWIEKKSAM